MVKRNRLLWPIDERYRVWQHSPANWSLNATRPTADRGPHCVGIESLTAYFLSSSGFFAAGLAGLAAGFGAGLAAGFDSGLAAGFDSGLGAGFDSGLAAGFDSGLAAGFDSALAAGFVSGFAAGFDSGSAAGFDSALAAGFGSGFAPELASVLGGAGLIAAFFVVASLAAATVDGGA